MWYKKFQVKGMWAVETKIIMFCGRYYTIVFLLFLTVSRYCYEGAYLVLCPICSQHQIL